MKYSITHTTKYAYQEPVPVCHNELRLTPRSTELQRCESHRLLIKPDPSEMSQRLDYYGNQVHAFSILEAHRGLSITAVSRLEVVPAKVPTQSDPWETVRTGLRREASQESLAHLQFVFDSPRIHTSSQFADYARESLRPQRPIHEAVKDLTRRIHQQFTYDPTATTVQTPLDDVWKLRRGVCQDFAHVQIACLRSLGLAARYVSGYLRTTPPPGRPRLVGADASHAWVSVFCGACGWVDFDPTNDVIPSSDHVTLTWGRDYGDVCPIRGVLVGGDKHTMSVSVDVEPLR